MSAPRRVLMISPHFPPDTSAASHRVRLLAPHLEEFSWTPTVLTLTSDSYEARLDYDLARLVPDTLHVVRCKALGHRITRVAGIGDLGLRAMHCLYAEAKRLLGSGKYSALFITIYPTYPALLGARLKKRFGVPFVLDYQDPWVGEWGKSVGAARGGRADARSRLSRRIAMSLEPRAVAAADAITAVSRVTYEDIVERIPEARGKPAFTIPLGGEPRDFEFLRDNPRPNPWFDGGDGQFHLCYAGALLPLGVETLRAFLLAVGQLRVRRPDLYARLRMHFFGTSNQTTGSVAARVMPHARELGVEERVFEHPLRIDYLDALTVQTQATALVLLGSTERHYTASKLYPALLARKPVLALYHEESSVTDVVREIASAHIRLVTYSDKRRPADCVDAIAENLAGLMDSDVTTVERNDSITDRWTARSLAGRLASVFDSLS